ncbi:MAG TPA: hypothetical protein VGR00_06660, partial [Thermoanaerobaculia bacterium]|nr:hypothetical protein [Thermoanaerobaculia bacterium]
AQAKASEVAAYFLEEKRPDNEASALCVVIQAALRVRALDAARAAASRAGEIADASQRRPVKLLVATSVARVRAAEGNFDEARAALQRVTKDATVSGLSSYTFEARLALGEILLGAKKLAEGRKELADLEAAAAAKGFGLVAREAALARKQVD